jgi:hypothetical protein
MHYNWYSEYMHLGHTLCLRCPHAPHKETCKDVHVYATGWLPLQFFIYPILPMLLGYGMQFITAIKLLFVYLLWYHRLDFETGFKSERFGSQSIGGICRVQHYLVTRIARIGKGELPTGRLHGIEPATSGPQSSRLATRPPPSALITSHRQEMNPWARTQFALGGCY